MRRITTDTADNMAIDGVVPGFTDGDAGTFVPPTRLNADAFNNYQEELARAVEGAGVTVRAAGAIPYYSQLDDAIQQLMEAFTPPASAQASYVLHGLRFSTSPANTAAVLASGQMVFAGRRYVITTAKIVNTLQDGWNLTASSDNYFYLAPADPAVSVFVPNRTTVFVRHLVVAVGAAAPSTPAGMFRFARITTDATGTVAVVYYDNGPRLINNNGAGIRLRSPEGVGVEAQLVTQGTGNVDIGTLVDPEGSIPAAGNFFRSIAVQTQYRRGAYSSGSPHSMVEAFTRQVTTTAGGSSVSPLISSDDYSDGSVAHVVVDFVAYSAADPSDGYAATARCMVYKDGSTWIIGGQTLTNVRAPVGGPVFTFNLDGTSTSLRMALTGHTTDIMRWFFDVKIVRTGPA